jgi:hypothetical protein
MRSAGGAARWKQAGNVGKKSEAAICESHPRTSSLSISPFLPLATNPVRRT